MFPILGAAIGGALLGGASTALQNERNIDLARENRDVQIQLADSAHQREVKDLRKAGLNPILSGTGGAGSAVPSSAAAQVEDIGESAVASAEAAGRMKQQMEMLANIREDTNLKRSQQKQVDYLGKLHSVDVQKRTEEWISAQEVVKQNKLRTQMMSEELQRYKAQAAAAKTEEDIETSDFGTALRWLDRIMRSLHGAGSSASSVRRGFSPIEVRPLSPDE